MLTILPIHQKQELYILPGYNRCNRLLVLRRRFQLVPSGTHSLLFALEHPMIGRERPIQQTGMFDKKKRHFCQIMFEAYWVFCEFKTSEINFDFWKIESWQCLKLIPCIVKAYPISKCMSDVNLILVIVDTTVSNSKKNHVKKWHALVMWQGLIPVTV